MQNCKQKLSIAIVQKKLSLTSCAHKSYRSFDAILRFFMHYFNVQLLYALLELLTHLWNIVNWKLFYEPFLLRILHAILYFNCQCLYAIYILTSRASIAAKPTSKLVPTSLVPTMIIEQAWAELGQAPNSQLSCTAITRFRNILGPNKVTIILIKESCW